MIRFKIVQPDQEPIFSEWKDEPFKHGPQNVPTATALIGELRQQYPDAAISIERTTVIPIPPWQMFRYDIFVRDGQQTVIDRDGERSVHLINATIQSRPFQEAEREAVIAEIRKKFPDAKLTEVKL